MLNGAHLPNYPFISGADRVILRAGEFDGALLMPEHGAMVMHLMRDINPAMQFVSRLPNSTQPDGHVPGAYDYAQMCADQINALHPYGVTYFQLDNEPMFQAFWLKDKCWEWQAFMADTLRYLRRAICPCVQIGLAPLVRPAWSGAQWAEQEALLVEWRKAAAGVALQCDWVAAHCYWQNLGAMNAQAFGMDFMRVHDFYPSKPLIITEYGNSEHEANIPAPQIETDRRAQYPDYLRQVRGWNYVLGAFVFLVGGTPEWKGFRVTEGVARAIGDA